jgi:outer membrane protein assembly factor BamB
LKKLYAITAQGRVRWSFTAGLAILGTPTLNAAGSVLYVPSFDHQLYALDARTGAKRWAFTTGDGIDASPTVGPDGTIYIGSYDANFYAINPSGTLKWKYNTGFLVETTAVIDKGGNVIFANDLGIVFAFTKAGALIGIIAFPAPIYSSVTIGPDVKLKTPLGKLVLYHSLYVADWGGNVYGYGYEDAPLSTGSPLLLAIQAWKFDSPLSFFSSPAVSKNNHMYLGGSDGNFYEFDGPTGQVLEQFPLGTATSASPAIGYDGTIYLGAGIDLYAFH